MNEFLNELILLMIKHDVYIRTYETYSDEYTVFEFNDSKDEELIADYQEWAHRANSRKQKKELKNE